MKFRFRIICNRSSGSPDVSMSAKAKSKYCQNKEIYQRMNFLYQAGTLMADRNPVLSCYYGNLVKAIGKKAVLRMWVFLASSNYRPLKNIIYYREPNIKRTICKRCGLILVIDTTVTIEAADENDTSIKLICKKCKYEFTYINNPKHKLWVEQKEAVIEAINFQSDDIAESEVVIK